MRFQTIPLLIGCLVLSLLASCGNREAHIAEFKEKVTAEMQAEQTAKADELKAIVQNFYQQLSTTPGDATAAKAATYMAENWASTPTPQGGPALTGFVQTLHMFHGMIPDLNWEVHEMLVDGNRVIVRSTASGTPNSPEGYFFGVPTDGSKSFEVQTIDIHTIEDGKMTTAFHVEDWATAIAQVSAPATAE